jgi:hypothetical protein
MALWGQSPMPQPRVPTGATSPGSPESTAAATVRASMAMSKSHPIVVDDGLDFEPAPASARGKKGIVIGVVAAVAAIGVGVFALRGGSSDKAAMKPAEVPTAAPAPAPAPAAAPAPTAVVAPAAPVEAAKPAVTPPEPAAVKPAPPPAEIAGASATHEGKGDGKGKGKSKPHGHGKETHGGAAAKPAAAKPAGAKPAAGGVPVID